ncbi:calcium-dependent phosphotriesterase [Xylaria digitata]|nr:calcium-dependent phosphotriesterase [Xylaria digitata]
MVFYVFLFGFLWTSASAQFLKPLPADFRHTPGSWAWLSYDVPSYAALPGQFNRSVFAAPGEATATDPGVIALNQQLNETDFVAYDSRFFDFIGPNATVKKVINLSHQTHEAPCLVPGTKDLFFAEWGPPGGENGAHDYQYLLDTETRELRNLTTDPPTVNAHGCVAYNGDLYVVTDGGPSESAYFAKIDPKTWKRTTLLNHYYEQPFGAFNDLEVDNNGNFYLTDSRSGSFRHVTPFTPPTNPSVYFVDGKTFRPKVIHITTGNANGVSLSPDGKTIYLPNTGVSNGDYNPYGDRGLWAYDFATSGGLRRKKVPVLTNARLLTNPIANFYDGIRVSKDGWIIVGANDGLDIINPVDGYILGSIRVGGDGEAVNIVLNGHEIWIVGRGGVWHVSNIKTALTSRKQ